MSARTLTRALVQIDTFLCVLNKQKREQNKTIVRNTTETEWFNSNISYHSLSIVELAAACFSFFLAFLLLLWC